MGLVRILSEFKAKTNITGPTVYCLFIAIVFFHTYSLAFFRKCCYYFALIFSLQR